MAFRLLQEGYRLATATEPLRAGGRDYPRGTLLARVERNPASLHERVAALAKELGVAVTTADTAYVDKGNVGPGSEEVVSLQGAEGRAHRGRRGRADLLRGDFLSAGQGHGRGVRADERRRFQEHAHGGFQRADPARWQRQALCGGVRQGRRRKAQGLVQGRRHPDLRRRRGGVRGGQESRSHRLAGRRRGHCSPSRTTTPTTTRTRTKRRRRRQTPADKDQKPEGQKAAPWTRPPIPTRKARPTEAPAATKKPGDKPADEVRRQPRPKGTQGGFDRRKIPLAVPGAIFRATVNRDHFLTYGYERDTLPVLVDTDQFLTLTQARGERADLPGAPDGNAEPAVVAAGGFHLAGQHGKTHARHGGGGRGTARRRARDPHRQRPELPDALARLRPGFGSTACSTRRRSTARGTDAGLFWPLAHPHDGLLKPCTISARPAPARCSSSAISANFRPASVPAPPC